MKYTMKDIAKICGVGVMTVSRAFDPNAHVSAETRKKILETAEKMSYTPNASARNLKSTSSKTIGWIVPDTNNQFYFRIIAPLQEKFRNLGYSLIMNFVTSGADEQVMFKSLLASRPEAILCSNPSKFIDLKTLPTTKIITLFSDSLDFPGVTIDDMYGIRIAAEYLIGLGHKKIMLAGGGPRSEVFQSTLAEKGLEEQSFVYHTRNYGLDELRRELNKREPTAIVSIGRWNTPVYAALAMENKSFPQDVSLIMYDDNELAQMMNIDVVAHPLELITDSIVDLTVKSIENTAVDNIKETISPILINRGSCQAMYNK